MEGLSPSGSSSFASEDPSMSPGPDDDPGARGVSGPVDRLDLKSPTDEAPRTDDAKMPDTIMNARDELGMVLGSGSGNGGGHPVGGVSLGSTLLGPGGTSLLPGAGRAESR